VPADADEARRVAEEVLSGPEYREAGESWITEVLNAIDEWFSRLFTSLGGGGGGSSAIGWIIVVLAVAGATVAVVLAVRSIRRSWRAVGEDDDDAERTSTRRRRREADVDWAREAERMEAEGRWRDGMRARYRALVAEMARRRVVDPAASRTTGEHRREVGSAAPEAAPDFDGAAELFDRAWYGNLPTGPEEAARFRELARQVAEEVG
jgi:hypothetical protein